jgi:hypothetical protein
MAPTRVPTHSTLYSVIPGYLAFGYLSQKQRYINSIGAPHLISDECELR